MGRGGPPKAKAIKIFREFDALAYDGKRQETPGDQRAAVNHIAKRRQKNKGAEVVFNPAAHKEYLTGFHKRKLARKKEGAENLIKKEKAERNQMRNEKRLALRDELGLDDNFGVDLSSDEADDNDAHIDAAEATALKRAAAGSAAARGSIVQVFEFHGQATTVTTLDLDPDRDFEGAALPGQDSSDSEEEEAVKGAPDGGAAGRRSGGSQQQRAPPPQERYKARAPASTSAGDGPVPGAGKARAAAAAAAMAAAAAAGQKGKLRAQLKAMKKNGSGGSKRGAGPKKGGPGKGGGKGKH